MSLTPIPVAGEPRAAVGVQQVVLRRRGGSVPDHGLRPRLLPPDLPPGRGAGTAALAMGLGVPGLPVPLCPGDGATRGSAVPRPPPDPRELRVSPGPVPRVVLPRLGSPRDKAGSWWLFWGGTGPVLQTRSEPGRWETQREGNRGGRARGLPCAGFGELCSEMWEFCVERACWGSARRCWEPQILLNDGERPRDCSRMVVGSQ